jgi:hypothetical protein
MLALLRSLPGALWWVTLSLAGLAVLVQIAIAVARSGAVPLLELLIEFAITLALLAIPVGIAWRGRRDGSLWYACGALVLLAALGKIFFF